MPDFINMYFFTIPLLYIYMLLMLLFFTFDNDDMKSLKRHITFFIVNLPFKICVFLNKDNVIIIDDEIFKTK